MDVEKHFHMTGGVGEKSYAQNSSLQKRAFDMVKHITIDTVLDLYLSTTPQSLSVADLGCSSGPNTLSVIREIINAIDGTSRKALRPLPEFRVFLNDLPGNDFNSIFAALPDFYKEVAESGRRGKPPLVFVAGVPGSFYGRLFATNSLHFIHSSYSLHWLSRVPPALYNEEGKSINKRDVYISHLSPPTVVEAYFSQFQEDFSLFLQSRSEELVPGGRMVLILLGRRGCDHSDRGNAFLWELLSRSLAHMVSEGDIEEEKLHSYNVHFYAPSREELQNEVKRQGSFTMDCFEMFEIERDGEDGTSYGSKVAMTVRAIQEPMLRSHFGEEIIDDLFNVYGRMIDEEDVVDKIRPMTFIMVLKKSSC